MTKNLTKTIFAKEGDTPHDWYLIDATGKPIGRLAAKIASILRGKNKPTYTPGVFTGDYVVVINADKVVLTGRKPEQKMYRHYTGYVGGLKSYNFNTLVKRHPEEPLKRAIDGMLPYGHLGRKLSSCVKIYAGSKHPHAAQNLKVLEV